MIVSMRLSSTLAWLVDSAVGAVQPDDFLATLGARLVDDGLPLAGGALTLAAPHPIITRRAWLWRAETGVVMEALGFGVGAMLGAGGAISDANGWRDWEPVLCTITRLGQNLGMRNPRIQN